MDKFINGLKIAFASQYTFAIKAQNFHWNVEGPLFPQLHELFGNIYEEVYESVDPFAENIRKLGSYTPASFQRFSMLTQVEDELNMLEDRAMIAELLQDSDKMVKLLKIVFDLSEQAGEHGLSDFIAGRMDAHRKHSWQLRATSKG
jgi:starvation-inducible DNA-binding protein